VKQPKVSSIVNIKVRLKSGADVLGDPQLRGSLRRICENDEKEHNKKFKQVCLE